MSAVAGAVALKVGENLKKRFGIKEVIVENGGDIYADLCQDMDISVFAGSPLCLKRSVCISRQPMPPSGFVPLPEPSVRHSASVKPMR